MELHSKIFILALLIFYGIHFYEIKAEYLENLQYLKRILPNVATTAVIFNGETLGSVINIREI